MDAPARLRPPVLTWIAFAAVCSVPLALRGAHPSLYSDDVARICQLQTSPSLGAILFVPFNEHMAPLFQVVSWTAWTLCGHRLAEAPLAFTIASFVPHVLSLLALGILVKREMRSTSTAMAAVAMLGLSSLIGETYAWYSASSFTWSMLGAIVAFDASGRAREAQGRRRAGWLAISAVASLLAPAGSGIGILAGPLAAIRWVPSPTAILPMLGTSAYLGICAMFRYREVLAASDSSRVNLAGAIRNVLRVPADVLAPGQFGITTLEHVIPDVVAIGLSVVMLAACLVWAWRSPRDRAWILGGVWLIVAGYALTIGLRTYPGSPMILRNERYQLFPQLGVVLLASVALRPWLQRFDTSPRSGAIAGLAVTAGILAMNLGAIRATARTYHWPDQAKTLAAMDTLAQVGRDRGITRDQIIAAVDPVRTRWFNTDGNALMMLPITVTTSRVAQKHVRPMLLAALTPAGREGLCGGMNVAKWLHRHAEDPGQTIVQGKMVLAFEMEAGQPGLWRARGSSSFLEFDLASASPADLASARVLVVPVSGPVEVWWSSAQGTWSEGKSVRWWPPQSGSATDWGIALQRLPHWGRATVSRVRIVPRKKGLIAAGMPRLMR